MYTFDNEIYNLLLIHSGSRRVCQILLKNNGGNRKQIVEALDELDHLAQRNDSVNYLTEKLESLIEATE